MILKKNERVDVYSTFAYAVQDINNYYWALSVRGANDSQAQARPHLFLPLFENVEDD